MYLPQKLVFLFVLALSFTVTAFGRSGDLDPSFNASLALVPDGTIFDFAVQPDGKIIVCGNFDVINGVRRRVLARLNSDGTTDPSFVPPVLVDDGQGFAVRTVAVQSNGKILIGGNLVSVNGIPRKGIARLNSDGSPDIVFNSLPDLVFVRWVHDIAVAPDDSIVFTVTPTFPSLKQFVYHLNPDGAFISANSNGGPTVLLLPDGKILNSGFDGVRRLNSDLTTDSGFQNIGLAGGQMARQADGKIIVAGPASFNGFPLGYIARLNADGTFDSTFNSGGSGANDYVSDVAVLPDGRIMIGGDFNQYNGAPRSKVAILNADGTLDQSYVSPFNFRVVEDIELQADGKPIVAGDSNLQQPFVHGSIARLNPGGGLDASFSSRTGIQGWPQRVVIQPDGKILVVGFFTDANGIARYRMARFNPNGSVDSGFVPAPAISSFYELWAIDVQPDGKILIGGGPLSGQPFPNLTRLNSDGSLDTVFPDTPLVRDIKVQPDGRILVAATGGGGQSIRRYNSDGTLSFTTPVNQPIRKIVLQPDGKILIAGEFTQVNSTNRGRIARLNADGTLDSTFNPPAGANGTINDMDLQSTGHIVIGGLFTGVNFAARAYVARLNPDGSLDGVFKPVLSGLANAWVTAVKVQADDRVLLGGNFDTVSGTSTGHVVRLMPGGSLDFSFTRGGPDKYVYDIGLQSDGKAIVVGEFGTYNGADVCSIVRLQNTPIRPAYDFNGDGRADVTVYRPSTGVWYQLFTDGSGYAAPQFGIPADLPAPADYDGDGKTDVAIWRQANGAWWYKSSINGAQVTLTLGEVGDIPRPSDFDGDGKADFVVFRPSTSQWLRFGTTVGLQPAFVFGQAGDLPVMGDFDGDGKSDMAIFRPSSGTWWYAASSAGNQFRAVQWGQNGDVPIPADYDGDGRTDVAVFRPSEGGWYIMNSSDLSFVTMAYGLNGDKPVPADYDGDGRVDIAVFRPSTGIWYLLQSTAGSGGVQWGLASDYPVPVEY